MSGRPLPASGAVVLVLVVLLALAWTRALRIGRATAAGRRLAGAEPCRSSVPPWFDAALARLDVPVDPSDAWQVATVAAGVGAFATVVRHPVAVVSAGPMVLAVGGAAASVLAVVRRRHRAAGRAIDAAAVVELLVAPLGSGATLSHAVARAAERAGPLDPAGRALADLRRAIDDGAAVHAAFDRWARRERHDGLRLVADALAVADVAGGSRVDALLSVGETVRERDALAREVRALGSQARTSAVVLAATPLAFTAAVVLADRRVASFLLGTPAGWGCLVLGVVAEAVGWWWMQRLLGALS